MNTLKLLRNLSLTLTILVLLLAPLPVWTQGVLEVTVNETESEEFPRVRATVTVIDENGIPVPGLDIASFQLVEDDIKLPITSVTPITAEDAVVSTALLLDISGSMSIPSVQPIDDAKAAATNFVNLLGDQDFMALVAFGSQVELGEPFPLVDPAREMDFTDDRDALETLIASLEARDEWTALYDAIFKGVRMASRQPAGNRAVILLTDGQEDAPPGDEPGGSTLEREAPISEAVRYGIPVFAIGLGTEIDEAFLSEVALRTGGTYISTQDSEALTELFQSVLERLKLRYIVEYSSGVLADGKEHSLRIEVSSAAAQASDTATFEAGLPDIPAVRGFFSFREGEIDEPLLDGEQLDHPLQITVHIDHEDPLNRVEFYMDGTAVLTPTMEPYLFPLDIEVYPLTHTLTVRAYDEEGDEGSASIDLVMPPRQPFNLADYWWALVLALVVVAIVVAVFLVLQRRRGERAACLECGGLLEPDWLKCPTCGATVSPVEPRTAEVSVFRSGAEEGATLPEQPLVDRPTEPGIRGVAPGARVPETVFLPKEGEPLALLIVDKGERRGQQFRLHAGDTTIGRLAANDIAMSDPTVSRRQAKIRLEGAEFYVHDLATTNPTRVNGQKIVKHRLRDGDKIQIGDTVLVFKRV